jgi:hypothetical protein
MQSTKSQSAFRSSISSPPSRFMSKLSNILAINRLSAELWITCVTLLIGSAYHLLLAIFLPDLLFSALKMEVI